MKLAAASEKRVVALQKQLQAVQDESRTLREELHERLLQYSLQLGRLSRTRSGESETPRLAARSVPLAVDDRQTREWEAVDGPPPDPAGREWLTLDACPACGHAQRTIVNPFNKLVLLKSAPDATAARYDYGLCHACGIVYATRRPFGGRYRHLLEHFGEVTGKGGGTIKNPLLNPLPLTTEDQEQLTRMAKRGVWVSDHLRVPKGEYLEGLIKDRFENSVHLDLLASLVAPKGGRVLEIRPRTGTISDGLRRLFGAEVFTLPIWESQRFLLKAVYGIDSPGSSTTTSSPSPSKAASISSSATTCSRIRCGRAASSTRLRATSVLADMCTSQRAGGHGIPEGGAVDAGHLEPLAHADL